MRNLFLIAKREYLQQVRSRSFRISTVLFPVILGGLMAAGYFAGREVSTGKRIAIASNDAALAADVAREIRADKDARFTVETSTQIDESALAPLRQRVQHKQLDGLLILETAGNAAPKSSFVSLSSGQAAYSDLLADALNRSLTRQRLIAQGMQTAQADTVLQRVKITALQLSKDGQVGKSAGSGVFQKATVLFLLMLMPITLYGMDTARSIIDEKTSRIFEVMLATARPSDLLAGKLLGVGAVGVTQIAIWIGCAIAINTPSLAGSLLSGSFSMPFTWLDAVLVPIYFVLGFVFYSALFSGLASTCETMQDLQTFSPFLILPAWIAGFSMPVLVSDPNSTTSILVSLFPFTAPFAMPTRVALAMPPLWQIALSIALMALSIWAVIWISSRLYRVGILMYGKRATLPEMLRWMRANG